jgi:methylated-DNA-[protein]-cysteine S-methyltransferase
MTRMRNRVFSFQELPSALRIGQLEVKTFGGLWLAWNESGLVKIAWTKQDLTAVTALDDGAALPPFAEVPEPYRTVLGKYFNGQAVDPARLPVVLYGTAFRQKVWRALREIPRGLVRSYEEIASAIGSPNAARAVGTACAINGLPIVVPCHRVIGAGMGLGGYSGGLERKIRLLELEGLRAVRGRLFRNG